jgi:hypothetical protein
LSPDILGTHKDITGHAKLGTHGGSSHTVLTRTSLGNDALLA